MYIGKLQIEKTLQTPISDVPQKPIVGPIKAGLTIKLIPDNPNSPVFSIIDIEPNLVTLKCERLSLEPNAVVSTVDFSLKVNETKTLYQNTTEGMMIYSFKVLETKEENSTAPTPNPNSKPNTAINYRMPTHYFNKVQNILTNLEKGIQSKIIVYYVPVGSMISQNDPEYFLEVLKKGERYPKISLILHSTGGDSMASYRIANLLRQYCDEFEIIIPNMASSAATNLSLAADVLKFSPIGYLSPIDTQQTNITDERLVKLGYSWISNDSYRRAKEMIDKEASTIQSGSYLELFKHIHPLVVAEADRLSSRSKLIATKMMKMQRNPLDDAKIDQITSHLVYDYPAHGFPILMKEAQEIGLNVESLTEDIYFQIWDLCKYYQSITRNQTTHINTESMHVESNEVIIETVGKRVVRRYSYDKIFSTLERRWQTANDNSSWKKYIPNSDPAQQPIVLNIEKVEDELPQP